MKTGLKWTIDKPAKATGDLIGNRIADKITNVSTKLHLKRSSKELKNGNEIEIPKER